MADWEEIKRLAADFQKVQLTSTSQKLSERNCIEIISYLKEKKIIDLIFTVDGKEFLTPSQLVTDIKNELYISGGRVNLVELAKTINVDLAHIHAHLKDVLKGQKDIHSILGQLIDSSYIAKIAGEINEKLTQMGQINVSDLTISYDLNAEFLQTQVIEKNLGKIIHAKQDANDGRIFFTEAFVARCRAKMRGALCGLTKPTPISSILNSISLNEKLFFSLFDQSSMFGTLTSRVVGAQFIPNVYARTQNEFVNNFFKQNNYIEFEALSRLGVGDYKAFIKKLFPDVLFLKSCAISKTVLERFEADLDECINSGSYLELQSNLPSVFSDDDIQSILDLVLTKQKLQQCVLIENHVFSHQFLEKLSQKCDSCIEAKAKIVVEDGSFQKHKTQLTRPQKVEEEDSKIDKKEERRKKAAGGKSGGGTQGRETKTKSTKKSRIRQISDEYESEVKQELEIITIDDILGIVESHLEEESLEHLANAMTEFFLQQMNEKAIKLAEEIYATTIADRTMARRHTHNEVQNKLNLMIGDVRLYEKGLKLLPEDLQSQLTKYLLRNFCNDILNEILSYICAEQNLSIQVENLNLDQKLKLANDLTEYKKALVGFIKSIQGASIEDFMTTFEQVLASCSMILKKIDKKKDRTIILNHKLALLEQLNKSDDLALVLHLATLVIFTTATQCMLNASGRHVAAILTFLKQFLTGEQVVELTSYHDFVTLMLSGGTEAESAKEKLKEKIQTIKNIANDFKRPGAIDKS